VYKLTNLGDGSFRNFLGHVWIHGAVMGIMTFMEISAGAMVKRLVNVTVCELENHHFLMGKLTVSMAIFNSYVSLPEGIAAG